MTKYPWRKHISDDLYFFSHNYGNNWYATKGYDKPIIDTNGAYSQVYIEKKHRRSEQVYRGLINTPRSKTAGYPRWYSL